MKAKSASKITLDNTKHIIKQIDNILGLKKAPANMSKIIKYISIWLTDLQHIEKWLQHENRYMQFIKKCSARMDEEITPEFFSRVIERTPQNMWEYSIFKLFMDEFYLLLERAKSCSNTQSNMDGLPREQVLEIVKDWHDGGKNMQKYEVENYLTELSIIYNCPETHIKFDIERIMEKSITLPGLMFNFTEVYSKNENIPRKYNYQQEYAYITHETFHKPYITISNSDKDIIIFFILKFNEYYKELNFKETGKHTNAPLYCCSLTCILELPFLQQYKEVLSLIPLKDKPAYTNINAKWFKFITDNKDLISKYIKRNDSTEEEAVPDRNEIEELF
jgi:hypothetical protein